MSAISDSARIRSSRPSLPVAAGGAPARRAVEVVLDGASSRPVTMRMSLMPAATASSTTYWMPGLSTSGIVRPESR